MGLVRILKAYRANWRYARTVREWERSPRYAELDAERDLPPRPLTPEELTLLRWALEYGSDEAKAFLPQIEGIRAARSCVCGCPTIRLVIAEDAVPAKQPDSRVLRDLKGLTERNELVGLMVLQLGGRLAEMEAYSIDGSLMTPEFGWPLIETLRELDAPEPDVSATN